MDSITLASWIVIGYFSYRVLRFLAIMILTMIYAICRYKLAVIIDKYEAGNSTMEDDEKHYRLVQFMFKLEKMTDYLTRNKD